MLKNIFKFNSSKECNVILSAGGVRCLAQIGALRALVEAGWQIKSICGISGGAVVASAFAYGIPLQKIEELAVNTNFTDFKKLNIKKLKQGIFRFNGLGNWVWRNCLCYGNPEDPLCDLNIGACSLTTGNKIIFNNPKDNTLEKSLEATCCIPLIFEPIEINNEYYADGALWSSAPIHFYEDSNLITFVIHVQNSHLRNFTSFSSPLHLLYRIFEVFQINRLKSLKKRIINKPVYIIEPSADHVSAMAFNLPGPQKKNIILNAFNETKLFLQSEKF